MRRCSGMPWSCISMKNVVAPEDVLQPPRRLPRAFDVVAQQRLEHVPAEAPGGDDQPLRVLGEQIEVDAGLVVVAAEVRLAAAA